MNETKDIATSFRYVVDMEAERNARARQYQSLSNIKSPRVNAKLTENAKPAVSDVSTEHSDPIPGPSTPKNKAPSEEPLSPSGSKGKRKVTFDIKPVVSIGEGETPAVEESGEGLAPTHVRSHWSDSFMQLRSSNWRMMTPIHLKGIF
jgi:hypothetical protein